MIRRLVLRWASRVMAKRPPDFIVGDHANPYLLRWWILPRNRFFNCYLHLFLRPDDDRALHDHPWFWVSWLLDGTYIEHTIAPGGIKHQQRFHAGSVRMHRSKFAHRIDLDHGQGAHSFVSIRAPKGAKAGIVSEYHPCTTLFFTGPIRRTWGFHCPDTGWVDFRTFTSPADRGQIGRGCDQ